MFRPEISTLFYFSFIFFISNGKVGAQLSDEICENLKEYGEFYDNNESLVFQQAELFLSYQHQIGHIDGTDQSGQNFGESFEEFRRFWMGFTGNFGTYWKFKIVTHHETGKRENVES